MDLFGMIKDSIGPYVSQSATKAFTAMTDPSKMTIQRIFVMYWEEFLKLPHVIQRGIRPIVIKEVEKMMACGTLDAGYEVYECPNCHNHHIICYTCKSRFCNSCGTKAAKIRAKYLEDSTLDVNHRHIVFTIDERLRVYFRKYPVLLNALFKAASDTLFYTFDKMNGKSKSFTPGFILTLHTFGRALNWNPHIHCLCTDGGMDDEGNYKYTRYINYEVLRKGFMKQLFAYMKEFLQGYPEEVIPFKKLTNQIYKEKKNGFYINAPKMKDKRGKKAVVNYIIRYTGRPVMASSRIMNVDFESNTIQYYYEDHKTNERIEVEEDIFEFMGKLLIHIPEEQFKMVRYYGLYATCDHRHKEKVKKMMKRHKKSSVILKEFSYRKELITVFGTDPFLCECGHYMEYVDYWVPKNRRMIEDGELC